MSFRSTNGNGRRRSPHLASPPDWHRCLVSGEHIDDAGEVELTQLAEDAASAFDLYDGDDIPEEVFEMAYQVGQKWEKMAA